MFPWNIRTMMYRSGQFCGKKLLVPVLLDDLKPTWTALPVDSGFSGGLPEHTQNVFFLFIMRIRKEI